MTRQNEITALELSMNNTKVGAAGKEILQDVIPSVDFLLHIYTNKNLMILGDWKVVLNLVD